jgi:hypothetical protein
MDTNPDNAGTENIMPLFITHFVGCCFDKQKFLTSVFSTY